MACFSSGLNHLTNTHCCTVKDGSTLIMEFFFFFFFFCEFQPVLGSEAIRGGRGWQSGTRDLVTKCDGAKVPSLEIRQIYTYTTSYI